MMPTKTCRICSLAKDTKDFPIKRKGGKEYLDSYCRECNRVRAREAYHKRGKEYQRLKSAQWAKANPERVKEHRMRFKERHPDPYQKNRRTPFHRSLHLFDAARTNARNKGIEFSLSRESIIADLERGVCQATGLRLSFDPPPEGMKRHPRAPSLDRIDPTKGYTPDNTVLVCWQYNAAKSQFPLEALDELVEALYRNRTIGKEAPRGEPSTTIP